MTLPVQREVVHNVAGYSEIGAKTWRTHAPFLCSAVVALNPHIANFQELSAVGEPDQLHTFDRLLEPWGRRASGGSDGRYNYFRDDITRITSGVFEAGESTLYHGDDKQASWIAVDHFGRAKALSISAHTEHEKGTLPDSLRIKQAFSFLNQGLAKARLLGIPQQNVMLTGDFNLHNRDLFAKMWDAGWKSAGRDGAYYLTPTFRGWDGYRHSLYDVAWVRRGVTSTLKVIRTSHSDHSRLHVTRELVRNP